MKEEDRTLKNLLRLYDAAKAVLKKSCERREAILDRLYEGHAYNPDSTSYSQEFYRAGWDEEGKLIVMRLGWSHYHGGHSRSWTCGVDTYHGPHDPEFLKKFNPHDARLDPPTEESTEMEQLSWVDGERRARRNWGRRWKKKVGFEDADPKLVQSFQDQSRRERQLRTRSSFILGKIGGIVQEQIQEKDGPRWGYGGADWHQNNRGVGPRVLIGCRVFHFQGDSLVEGEPCPTVEFKGSEMRGWRPEDDINESWAATCEEPLADMKKRARTANVHRYVAERRESRERWKKEGE